MAHYFIGIMSGTSLDGVDTVIAHIKAGKTHLVAHHSHPFEPTLKTALTALIQSPLAVTLPQLGHTRTMLSRFYAKGVLEVLQKAALSDEDILAIGCHGQTLYHAPEDENPFTLQLLDPAILAAETGIHVVSDFRAMDMALGGQGAPLVPPFHQSCFEDTLIAGSPCVGVINLGGIANVTLFQPSLCGFDTGPANTLMDTYCQHAFQCDFDENGSFAQSGTLDEALLKRLLEDPFFTQAPPKSTGREYFNLAWLQKKLTPNTRREDVLNTLTELSAITVAEACKTSLPEQTGTLLCAGGGAKNPYFMVRLAHHLAPFKLALLDEVGMDAQHLEALAFAWLGAKRLCQQPSNATSVTGARQAASLGCVTLAPGKTLNHIDYISCFDLLS